jgi:hypothetical protein
MSYISSAVGILSIEAGLPMGLKALQLLMKKEEWLKVLRVLQTWMYSWMRPEYCESKEELEISKALFQAYIQSEVFILLPFLILYYNPSMRLTLQFLC